MDIRGVFSLSLLRAGKSVKMFAQTEFQNISAAITQCLCKEQVNIFLVNVLAEQIANSMQI